MVKVDLAVVDDRVVPVDDVKRTIGADLEIDRAVGLAGRTDERLDLLRREAAALVRDAIADRAVGSEIIFHDAAPPFLGEMPAGQRLTAGTFGLAGHEAGQGAGRADGTPKRSPGEGEVRPLTSRAVGDERLTPAIDRVAPRVDRATRENLEPLRFRPEPPEATAVEPAFAPARVDEAVDVNRLVEVQLTPWRPAQRVDHVMDVGVAETGKDHPPLILPVVAIGVGQKQKLGGAADVGTALHRHDGVGDEQSFGEHRPLFSDAVAIGILKNDNAVVGFRARLDVRVGGTHRDPRPAPGIPVQVDRVGENRARGEQVQREAVGDRHAGQFVVGVRVGDVSRNLVLGVVVNRLPLVNPLDGITMRARRAQPGDAFLGRRHQPVEILHLIGQVPHFIGAEQENVGAVQRPEPSAVLKVFLEDFGPQLLGGGELRPVEDRLANRPALGLGL